MKRILRNTVILTLCVALCLSISIPAFAAEDRENSYLTVKDETVYVLAGADGNVREIIVSDWIKNTSVSSSFTDLSELLNIENVNGDESYKIDENAIVWDAEGNDIYYRGTTEKELPVNMTVYYKLDGNNISADEIAGKSGKVTIRYEYENKQSEAVTINGKEENINVPFAMLTGMLLDTDRFRNIEVSNGKIMNDGDRTTVIGIAFPGLQENLGIGKEKLNIPEYVEITADVTDFCLGMTVTLATNDLFNNIDTSKLYLDEDLSKSIQKLSEGMNQLLDGSSALYAGLDTLLEKSGELVSGIETLANGASALKDGAISVDNGVDALMNGVTELSAGLDTLRGSNDTLNTAAKKVFETMLSTAEAQIKAAGVTIPSLSIENYKDTLNYIVESLGNNPQSKELEVAKKSIISIKSSLDDYNTFYVGLNNYTAGVASAADGAAALASGTSDLKNGTVELNEGAASLFDGVCALNDGAPALVDGVSQLKDGAMQLNAGLAQFNDEGIVKIIDLADGDIGTFTTRLKATIDVSKKYYNYSGIDESMEGQVKFIYRTDEIE